MSARLNQTTLVLNADFTPMTLFPLMKWTAQKVFNHIASGSAVVVAEYQTGLRSAHCEWKMPSVVALKHYVKAPQKVAFTRNNILIRDECKCQYCGTKLVMGNLTFDHVWPKSRGGPTNFSNIVAACMACNARKANRVGFMKPFREPREPTQREMVALKPLRRDEVHESWVDFLEYQGILIQPEAEKSQEQQLIDKIYWDGVLEKD